MAAGTIDQVFNILKIIPTKYAIIFCSMGICACEIIVLLSMNDERTLLVVFNLVSLK